MQPPDILAVQPDTGGHSRYQVGISTESGYNFSWSSTNLSDIPTRSSWRWGTSKEIDDKRKSSHGRQPAFSAHSRPLLPSGAIAAQLAHQLARGSPGDPLNLSTMRSLMFFAGKYFI